MSRRILCEDCGNKYPKSETKILFEPTQFEPAEYGRIVKGLAKSPTQNQRKIFLNDISYALPLNHYDCDLCGRIINPGDKATCISIWTSNQREPSFWEHDFIKASVAE